MNKEEFKSGDVVILRSGGPLMTVENKTSECGTYSPNSRETISCIWFEHKELKRANFNKESIKKISDTDISYDYFNR